MKYERDYLDKVICRADFVGHLELGKDGPPSEFYAAVKDRFPIVEFADKVQTTLTIGPGPVKSKEEKNEYREWIYHGKERTKKLIVTKSSLILIYTQYEYYETLRDDFLSALMALNMHVGPLEISRLGLRYIDILQGIKERGPFDWDDLLVPTLTEKLKIASDKRTLSRAFTVIEFNYGIEQLKFQYGIHNPDYPATIKKQQFILDYDMSTKEIVKINEVAERLNRFHRKLIDSFEEVITQNLRDLMIPKYD